MPESTGALTEAAYYILLALFEDRHGYAIMQQVEQMSNGRVHMGAGTLYGALKALQQKGLIAEATHYERKKEYSITAAGRQAVQTEVDRLAELLHNGQAVIAAQTAKEEGK
jgi:DNA-binding PadR family transcriptional regulator